MEIKFTKEELKKLLELLNIADWVLTSQDVEEDERKYSYLKLLQRIYKEAYENGMTEEIEFDEEVKEYFPNEEWEERVLAHDFIEEFEDASFWDELVFRLADRDIDRKMNGKPPKNFEEHVAMFTQIQSKYEEEFEKNNLENLEIVANQKDFKKSKTLEKKQIPAQSISKKSSNEKQSDYKKSEKKPNHNIKQKKDFPLQGKK